MSGLGAAREAAWADAERQLGAVARQALRRSLRRPALVIALATLAAAGVTTLRAVRPPLYEAVVYLRIDEGEVDDATGPERPQNIREHIANVALSAQNLERIMRKHRRAVAWLARNREAAIDDFRSEIGVEVTRDYFIWGRSATDPPRSAHVSISFRGNDEESARAIVRELGDTILEVQAAQRGERLESARQLLETQIGAARAHAASLQRSMAGLRLQASSSDTRRAIGAQAQLSALESQNRTALDNLLLLERRRADLAFRLAAEERNLGVSFAPFDDALITLSSRLTWGQVVRRAILALLVALLLVATVIGAFDDRLYEPADVRAHGLPALGALPLQPGDEVGSRRAPPQERTG
ncbi:MAG: hypothetical protein HZB56_20475 [Deltaproteobacteria bacterium]|nr:hypothetical protein [Deltaproteobacteria bacterium]